MSEPIKVFVCDCCNRVVAKLDEEGRLVLIARHDGEYHHTTITGHFELREEKTCLAS